MAQFRPPLFRQTPSLSFFCEPPHLNSDFSVNSQNIKTCSSLIPSYLLKVTKSFGKIPWFELLVITEKNIFACKLFLLLNISDFNFLCVKIALPLGKKSSPFSQQPSLKVEVLPSPPFLKIWLEVQPPPPPPSRKGVGAQYV